MNSRAQALRLPPEVAELQLLIAHHARVRRAPRLVLAGEIMDDLLLELARFLHHVMRNAEGMGHAARIRDGRGSAALVLRAGDAVLRPDLHGHADHVVALLLEQMRGDGGIDSSAHSDDDAGFGGGHGERDTIRGMPRKSSRVLRRRIIRGAGAFPRARQQIDRRKHPRRACPAPSTTSSLLRPLRIRISSASGMGVSVRWSESATGVIFSSVLCAVHGAIFQRVVNLRLGDDAQQLAPAIQEREGIIRMLHHERQRLGHRLALAEDRSGSSSSRRPPSSSGSPRARSS